MKSRQQGCGRPQRKRKPYSRRKRSDCRCQRMHHPMGWVQFCPTFRMMGQRSQLRMSPAHSMMWRRGLLYLGLNAPVPIAYVSRTLNDVEKRYALAIVFGVKRFHQYRHFSICSDHKPLQYLLSESKAIPTMASARLALILSAYQYSISYRPGEKMANADALSRLPLPTTPEPTTVPQEVVFLLQTLQSSPVTAEQVKRWTDRDPTVSRVRNLVAKGWSEDLHEDTLTQYQQRKAELSLLDGCVLWVIVPLAPLAGRSQVLDLLHDCHPGITKMKLLSRQVVWWPGIDKVVTNKVQSCARRILPVHPYTYLGPFQGKTILAIIDAHSKWIEVASTSSNSTIKVLVCSSWSAGTDILGQRDILYQRGPSSNTTEFDTALRRPTTRLLTAWPNEQFR